MERFNDRPLDSVLCSDIGEGLRTVKLCGWGAVQSTHGSFTVDEAGAEATVKAFDAHGADVPIDIEHSTLDASLPPEQRGAIGWVTKVFAEAGRGLFALVKWSDKGRALIRAGAFKYLSPVFAIGKDDRRVMGLHSAAVTTKPALVKAELLAASQGARKGTVTMETHVSPIIEELAGLIGMKVEADTTGMAVLTACRDKLRALVADAGGVRTALGLPNTADANAVVVALAARIQGDAGGAAAEVASAKERIRDLETDALMALHGAGKLNPHATDLYASFKEMARNDPDRFVKCVASMPVIVPQGRTNPPTSRQLEIVKAEREFRADARHGKVTTCVAFVNDTLRENGFVKLSDDEARELLTAQERMGDQTTKLTLQAVTAGMEKAATDLQHVAEGQKQVTEQSSAMGKATQESAGQTDKLNATTEDYFGLLRKVNPQLAEYAQAAFRAVKVTGELGVAELDVNKITELATGGIAKLGGTLGLLAAAGVAATGFTLLADSIRKVREEAEQAQTALDNLHKSQTELQRGVLESAADVVAARDKSGRTPFDAVQQKAVEDTLAAAPEQLRSKLGPVLAAFGGAKERPGAGPFTGAELESLAALGFDPNAAVEPGSDLSRGLRAAGIRPLRSSAEDRARTFLQLRGADAARIAQRERAVAAARRAAALQEATVPEFTGGQANFRRIVEEEAKARGVDPDLVQSELERSLRNEAWRRDGGADAQGRRFGFVNQPVRVTERGELPEIEVGDDKWRRMTSMEASAHDEALRRLTDATERLGDIMRDRPTGDSYYGTRHVVPSATEQARRRSNGESRARSVER